MRIYPWFEVLMSREPLAAEVNRQNERQVNVWRMTMTGLLALVSAFSVLRGGWTHESAVVAGAVLLGLSYSSLVFLALQVSQNFRWIQYTTIILDAALVSATLASFMGIGRGILATNSQTTFLLYFFVLGMAGRRYDIPLAVLGGAAVLVNYSAVVLLGYFAYDLPHAAADPEYGVFIWQSQFGRAAVLAVSAVMMVNTVIRSRRLRELSIRDPLLGIYNRRYFEEVLALEFEYSCKLGRSLTLVMMDVDRFKAYNDTLGHMKGDRLLMAVADALLRSLRRNDVLARYGGDEFVFLLMETPPEGAGAALARLQQSMGLWLRDIRCEGGPEVSFSFGMAVLNSKDHEPGDLMSRADRHLYRAKAAGGGVICDEEGRILPEGLAEDG
jgi:diguanylate cyclase (GGDEF)-like protein